MIALLLAAAILADPRPPGQLETTGTFSCATPACSFWTAPTNDPMVFTMPPIHLPAAFLRDPQRFCDALIAAHWVTHLNSFGGDFSGSLTIRTEEGTLACSDTAPPRLLPREVPQ